MRIYCICDQSWLLIRFYIVCVLVCNSDMAWREKATASMDADASAAKFSCMTFFKSLNCWNLFRLNFGILLREPFEFNTQTTK